MIPDTSVSSNLINLCPQWDILTMCPYWSVYQLVYSATFTGPPKVLPISTAESYPEGSRVNLVCSVSHGQRNDLTLTWFRDSDIIDENYPLDQRWTIDNQGEVSLLKIKSAKAEDTGNYTCIAKNSLGIDSSSAQLIINGNNQLSFNFTPHRFSTNHLDFNISSRAIVKSRWNGPRSQNRAWSSVSIRRSRLNARHLVSRLLQSPGSDTMEDPLSVRVGRLTRFVDSITISDIDYSAR